MFVITRQPEPLSTAVMKFAQYWIYDLSAYHDFWRSQAAERAREKVWAVDTSIWKALKKIYGAQTFSSIDTLLPFAQDFHHHRRYDLSDKKAQDLFRSLHRLGLVKVGHLERLPPAQIQKRFGKSWGEFFRGILSPDTAPWVWEPYRKREPLSWQIELEDPSVDAALILGSIMQGLECLSSQQPDYRIKKLSLILQLSDPEHLDFEFPHPIYLKETKDRSWIRRLLEERLHHLCLDAAVWKISVKAITSDHEASGQLSLFRNAADTEKVRQSLERLENQGFEIFKPQIQNSYLPEECWNRISALKAPPTEATDSRHGLIRPLIQFEARPISTPEGALKFTERIQWYDKNGLPHFRDYYLTRLDRRWAWVFQNENSQWFHQGVIE